MKIEEIVKELPNMTDKDLDILVKTANRTKEEKRVARLCELKTNFKKAWFDLTDAGIQIIVNDEPVLFNEIDFD